MDLRHDIAIMAFIGPIETYTEDDGDPQNAKVFTFLSRSIQQATSPAVKRIVAQAREDFLHGIAKPHGVKRTWRFREYEDWKGVYMAKAAERLSSGLTQDDNGRPWEADAEEYQSRLDDMAIGGVYLESIDPLVYTSQPESGATSAQSGFRTPAATSAFPASIIPVPAAVPQSQSFHSMTQQLSSLSIGGGESHFPNTAAVTVDHERWGLMAVPQEFSVSPAINFVLAAEGVGNPKIAMVKCILGDAGLKGDDCITKLEDIPLDFAVARIIAYLAGRLGTQ